MDRPALEKQNHPMTRAALGVSEALAARLSPFLEERKIELELTSSETAQRQGRQLGHAVPCNLETFHARGWIPCHVALAMAPRLGIDSRQLGQILDFLEIKVHECGLGCF